MSRTDIMMESYPKGNKLPKNLRYNAREYAEYANDHPFKDDPDAMRPVGRAGRSSGTNN